ncbi:hypothetical protein Bpfe_005127 [Biomphalaria pfeifferi]|uniref:Uncharacterized protein n=1 Tax=Biomphalaria pfeifferi TaxID=112525 RepID=A0AAD8C534_BIOPF|nr:hypothetical protein Bpfe_005127 [Biomphalaria pfeifferi]
MLLNFYESYFYVTLNSSTSNLFVTILSDCLQLIQAVINIIKIMIYFTFQVVLSIFNALAFGFGKIFLNTLYWAAWIAFHFTCGILGLEDKSTSAFSWLLLMFILALYCERNNQELFSKIFRIVVVYHHRLFNRVTNQIIMRNTLNISQDLLDNQRNEHREIEPINRLLEAENQVNENEENSLVEADRHRIDNDNRRNIERENGVDDHRANLENHQNVQREIHNTRISLDNHRNSNQEQQRYFLRQRGRDQQLHNESLAISQHGVSAVVLPALAAYNMLPLSRNDFILSRSNTARLNI